MIALRFPLGARSGRLKQHALQEKRCTTSKSTMRNLIQIKYFPAERSYEYNKFVFAVHFFKCFSFIFIYENDNHQFNKAIVTVIPPKAISFSSSFARSMKQNSLVNKKKNCAVKFRQFNKGNRFYLLGQQRWKIEGTKATFF